MGTWIKKVEIIRASYIFIFSISLMLTTYHEITIRSVCNPVESTNRRNCACPTQAVCGVYRIQLMSYSNSEVNTQHGIYL